MIDKDCPRPARVRRSLVLRALGVAIAGVAAVGLMAPSAQAAETKSWVVSWFMQATYSQDGDCPQGENPSIYDAYREILKNLGKTPAEMEAIFKNIGNGGSPATQDIFINRGRIDGKPVNIYDYPWAEPDPHLHTVEGKYAFGFNLDGKGAASPGSYEDPETHEKGVNNQYYRALGCNKNHRAFPPDRPAHWAYVWEGARDSTPAWLISVTGADLSKDGDVSVTFDRALKHATLDANGNVLANATFRVDSDPRSHNELTGRIANGVLIIETGDLHMVGDPFHLAKLDLRQTHLRMKLRPDGAMDGFIGGYQPWMDIYFSYGSTGYVAEVNEGIDHPGVYFALRRLADAYPDPVTGQNTAISTAYRIEAVPAFTLPPAGAPNRTAQASPTQRTP